MLLLLLHITMALLSTASTVSKPLQLWADLRRVPTDALPAQVAKCCEVEHALDAILVTEGNGGCEPTMLRSESRARLYLCPCAVPGAVTSLIRTLSDKDQVGVRADASADGQAAAMAAVGSTDWVFLDAASSDWTMIPAENVISVCDGTPTQLAVTAFSPEQVPGLAFALQLGVDAVVLPPPDEADSVSVALWEAAAIARAQRAEYQARDAGTTPSDDVRGDAEASTLTTAVVTAVETGGVGDRVALDFTSLLRMGEGALVGSSSKLLSLVHGETIEGTLVPARPFRVNAGPVHSYVLLADGRTKYLQEVRPGDEVLITDAHGASRALTVGRCKVEPRPLLMISYEAEATEGQIFLQQAETVRVLVENDDGAFEPRSVTELKAGERLRVQHAQKGTHVGRRISARVEER